LDAAAVPASAPVAASAGYERLDAEADERVAALLAQSPVMPSTPGLHKPSAAHHQSVSRP